MGSIDLLLKPIEMGKTQNVYYLEELCKWASDSGYFDHFYFNMLHYPDNMSIAQMTPEAQELVINKYTIRTTQTQRTISKGI